MTQCWNGSPVRPQGTQKRHLGRREVLHSLLGGAALAVSSGCGSRLVVGEGTGTPATSIQRFTSEGGGSRDGTSWQHAMAVDRLESALASAEPGSNYVIGFDPHSPAPVTWKRTLVHVRNSGEAGKPIEITAGYLDAGGNIAAAPQDAPFFFQGLNNWTPALAVSRDAPRGAMIFSGDVSHVVLSGFRVEGAGFDGFVKFGTTRTSLDNFEDIAIRNIAAHNVGRVIESTKAAKLKNITIENCEVRGAVRGFARFWNISDSTLRNLVLDADHIDGGKGNPCQLIGVFSGSNVTFENVTLKNAINAAGVGYTEGDGIVCERGTSNFVIRGCHASGMGDGGFDAKTTDLTIEDSTAEDCKYGARIWSQSNNVVRRCAFKSRASALPSDSGCMQVGGRATVTDTTLEVAPGTCAFHLPQLKDGNPPHVQMIGGSIHLADGARLLVGEGNALLELKGVSVNGVTKDGTFTK